MVLAPYLDLHSEHIKILCRATLEIAQIELMIENEALKLQHIKFPGIEKLILIDQSIKGGDW